jgi:small-conductance mechanosensitive channel
MRPSCCFLALLGLASLAGAGDSPPQQTGSAADSRAVMTGEQVIQILDETVDWYRTLGTQAQAATQPSDLLILYANRQTADKVIALAFEIARANAELLSSEASAKQASSEADSPQSLSRVQAKLDEQRATIQAQIEAIRHELSAAAKESKADLQAKIAVLQGELDMLNARRNMLTNMSQFAGESEATGANALKSHIDAIAASIPASGTTAQNVSRLADEPTPNAGGSTSFTQFGIWDLASTVFRLAAKARTIDTIDERTARLYEVFTQVRTAPLAQLKSLTTRGDAIAAQADSADGVSLKGYRDQYDTLAWLYQQTSSIVAPLSKASTLLNQYRRNLSTWRDATQKQYYDALKALGWRLAFFALLLGIVFAISALWRRIVFRYVHDPRRRYRYLLLQKIVFWCLVVAIVASIFATELGSLATFAGLITAGLAVAMQSVLVSLVGYFFLIGKYGIRVGDRVQIGNVTGEVIDLGLVRLHLMELSGQGSMSPTGRVVAFANSIIFQASGGLFKQIPGVDLAWHEITLTLPMGADYAALKDRLVAAAQAVINDYHADIQRQTLEIRKASRSRETGDAQAQVQLRFAATGVEAIVRYPVQLSHAAEIDERVSREVLNVVSAHAEAKA